MRQTSLFLLALLTSSPVLSSCVPNGPPGNGDAGTKSGTAIGTTARRPLDRPAVIPPQRPAAVPGTAAFPPAPPLGPGFEDGFQREALGPDWRLTSPVWKVEGGRLCGQGARNHPVWLARRLPTNVRIEFDAVSQSPDGDLKAEFFGDGASAATGTSYTDATSYLTILGGWKNSFHVLARINEHAPDRHEIRVDPHSDDERQRPVSPGQVYHFRVERRDGSKLSWWIGDNLMFNFDDPQPLAGPGHEYFGFNDWDVPVCFDNVKITPL